MCITVSLVPFGVIGIHGTGSSSYVGRHEFPNRTFTDINKDHLLGITAQCMYMYVHRYVQTCIAQSEKDSTIILIYHPH